MNTGINKKSPGTGLAKIVDVVGLLWRAPRTIVEIERLTGGGQNIVRRYFYLLEAEGLIARDGKRGTSVLYKWVDR